ncbi:arabinose operon protein AraL [bacterium BMS3Abin04]|nr:arabinose operon protein AraL [bacterium BMS3Abin04]
MLNKYNAFIFDLDGTIYRGENLIPRSDLVVNKLKELGKKVVFISNKTTGSVDDYFNFLFRKGLNIEKEEIINSTVVTQEFLMNNHPGEYYFAIGERTFINEINKIGLVFTSDPLKTKIVLVTLDRTLDYSKLEVAAKALENGARFYAANIDDTCPVEGGEIMDAGSIITALEKRTHLKLEKHFGKPSEFMMNKINSLIKIDSQECLLIGDRVETDIAMGNKFNIDTALVSTGVTNFLNGKVRPTYKIKSVYDILQRKVK